MPSPLLYLQLLLRSLSGRNTSQSVLVLPDSRLRFDFNGEGVSDPIMSGFDTFDRLPVTDVAAADAATIASVAAANLNFTLGGTSNAFVIRDGPKGGMWMYTTGVAEQAMLQPFLTSRFYVRSSDRSLPVFEMRAGVSKTSELIAAIGLSQNADDPDISSMTGDGALFLYDPDGVVSTGLATTSRTNWILATVVQGVFQFQDSGITVVRSQDYVLRIVMNALRQPTYFINGVQVGVIGAALRTVDVKAFAGLEQLAANSVTMIMRYIFCGRALG